MMVKFTKYDNYKDHHSHYWCDPLLLPHILVWNTKAGSKSLNLKESVWTLLINMFIFALTSII